MAEPLQRVPELPLFASLLRRLSCDDEQGAAQHVRAFLPGLHAGLSSFRPRTTSSASVLRSHAFEYGARGKVSVGAKAAALVAALSPCLALEEAQTYLLLRRAFGASYSKQSFCEETARKVCETLFAERTAAAFLPAQLAALAGPAGEETAGAGSLGEALRAVVGATGGEGEGVAAGGYGGVIGAQLLAALQRAQPVRPNAFEFAVLEEAWEEQNLAECVALTESALCLCVQRWTQLPPSSLPELLAASAARLREPLLAACSIRMRESHARLAALLPPLLMHALDAEGLLEGGPGGVSNTRLWGEKEGGGPALVARIDSLLSLSGDRTLFAQPIEQDAFSCALPLTWAAWLSLAAGAAGDAGGGSNSNAAAFDSNALPQPTTPPQGLPALHALAGALEAQTVRFSACSPFDFEQRALVRAGEAGAVACARVSVRFSLSILLAALEGDSATRHLYWGPSFRFHLCSTLERCSKIEQAPGEGLWAAGGSNAAAALGVALSAARTAFPAEFSPLVRLLAHSIFDSNSAGSAWEYLCAIQEVCLPFSELPAGADIPGIEFENRTTGGCSISSPRLWPAAVPPSALAVRLPHYLAASAAAAASNSNLCDSNGNAAGGTEDGVVFRLGAPLFRKSNGEGGDGGALLLARCAALLRSISSVRLPPLGACSNSNSNAEGSFEDSAEQAELHASLSLLFALFESCDSNIAQRILTASVRLPVPPASAPTPSPTDSLLSALCDSSSNDLAQLEHAAEEVEQSCGVRSPFYGGEGAAAVRERRARAARIRSIRRRCAAQLALLAAIARHAPDAVCESISISWGCSREAAAAAAAVGGPILFDSNSAGGPIGALSRLARAACSSAGRDGCLGYATARLACSISSRGVPFEPLLLTYALSAALPGCGGMDTVAFDSNVDSNADEQQPAEVAGQIARSAWEIHSALCDSISIALCECAPRAVQGGWGEGPGGWSSRAAAARAQLSNSISCDSGVVAGLLAPLRLLLRLCSSAEFEIVSNGGAAEGKGWLDALPPPLLRFEQLPCDCSIALLSLLRLLPAALSACDSNAQLLTALLPTLPALTVPLHPSWPFDFRTACSNSIAALLSAAATPPSALHLGPSAFLLPGRGSNGASSSNSNSNALAQLRTLLLAPLLPSSHAFEFESLSALRLLSAAAASHPSLAHFLFESDSNSNSARTPTPPDAPPTDAAPPPTAFSILCESLTNETTRNALRTHRPAELAARLRALVLASCGRTALPGCSISIRTDKVWGALISVLSLPAEEGGGGSHAEHSNANRMAAASHALVCLLDAALESAGAPKETSGTATGVYSALSSWLSSGGLSAWIAQLFDCSITPESKSRVAQDAAGALALRCAAASIAAESNGGVRFERVGWEASLGEACAELATSLASRGCSILEQLLETGPGGFLDRPRLAQAFQLAAFELLSNVESNDAEGLSLLRQLLGLARSIGAPGAALRICGPFQGGAEEETAAAAASAWLFDCCGSNSNAPPARGRLPVSGPWSFRCEPPFFSPPAFDSNLEGDEEDSGKETLPQHARFAAVRTFEAAKAAQAAAAQREAVRATASLLGACSIFEDSNSVQSLAASIATVATAVRAGTEVAGWRGDSNASHGTLFDFAQLLALLTRAWAASSRTHANAAQCASVVESIARAAAAAASRPALSPPLCSALLLAVTRTSHCVFESNSEGLLDGTAPQLLWALSNGLEQRSSGAPAALLCLLSRPTLLSNSESNAALLKAHLPRAPFEAPHSNMPPPLDLLAAIARRGGAFSNALLFDFEAPPGSLASLGAAAAAREAVRIAACSNVDSNAAHGCANGLACLASLLRSNGGCAEFGRAAIDCVRFVGPGLMELLCPPAPLSVRSLRCSIACSSFCGGLARSAAGRDWEIESNATLRVARGGAVAFLTAVAGGCEFDFEQSAGAGSNEGEEEAATPSSPLGTRSTPSSNAPRGVRTPPPPPFPCAPSPPSDPSAPPALDFCSIAGSISNSNALAHLSAGWFSPHALRCVEPHSNSGAERSIRTGVAAELYRAAFHAASFLCAVAALRPPRAEAFDSNSSNSSNALWPLPGALRALRSSVGRLIEQCEAGEHAMRASEFCASLHALRKAVERLAATPLLPA